MRRGEPTRGSDAAPPPPGAVPDLPRSDPAALSPESPAHQNLPRIPRWAFPHPDPFPVKSPPARPPERLAAQTLNRRGTKPRWAPCTREGRWVGQGGTLTLGVTGEFSVASGVSVRALEGTRASQTALPAGMTSLLPPLLPSCLGCSPHPPPAPLLQDISPHCPHSLSPQLHFPEPSHTLLQCHTGKPSIRQPPQPLFGPL